MSKWRIWATGDPDAAWQTLSGLARFLPLPACVGGGSYDGASSSFSTAVSGRLLPS